MNPDTATQRRIHVPDAAMVERAVASVMSAERIVELCAVLNAVEG